MTKQELFEAIMKLSPEKRAIALRILAKKNEKANQRNWTKE